MIVQPTFISPAAYGIRSRTVTGVQTCALPIPVPNEGVWDGSDLGPLHPSCVVGLATTGTTTKRRYWCLDIGGHRVEIGRVACRGRGTVASQLCGVVRHARINIHKWLLLSRTVT